MTSPVRWPTARKSRLTRTDQRSACPAKMDETDRVSGCGSFASGNRMSANPHTVKFFESYISDRYRCKAVWIATVPIDKSFRPGMTRESIVHVFELSGHERANRCYVWTYNDGGWHYDTVLGVPPVTSAETAIQKALMRTRGIRRPSKERPGSSGRGQS